MFLKHQLHPPFDMLKLLYPSKGVAKAEHVEEPMFFTYVLIFSSCIQVTYFYVSKTEL